MYNLYKDIWICYFYLDHKDQTEIGQVKEKEIILSRTMTEGQIS